ncbi:MAG: hypothetical protein ACRD4Y_18455 [Candidatus Acidiferrales bacterium]
MFAENEISDLPLGRKTQRILARVPLSVSGKTDNMVPFEEESFTIAVNPEGALLLLRNKVTKGQCLTLSQANTGQRELCIIANVKTNPDGYTFASVVFPKRHPEFWHVTFPPNDWTQRHPDSKFNRRAHLPVEMPELTRA